MAVIKPLEETPAHRTRRVLSRLRLPEPSTIAWLGAFVGLAAAVLNLIGLLVGGPASEMFQSYVNRLRELWMQP
jgi:hypothetical protein